MRMKQRWRSSPTNPRSFGDHRTPRNFRPVLYGGSMYICTYQPAHRRQQPVEARARCLATMSMFALWPAPTESLSRSSVERPSVRPTNLDSASSELLQSSLRLSAPVEEWFSRAATVPKSFASCPRRRARPSR